ncbi:hypothetical protein [Acidiphilium sp.]|uniref:hypothetical protein n=1 Tax=Acidiphilium sp. TaxID=527 RepID=UPI003CFDDB2E
MAAVTRNILCALGLALALARLAPCARAQGVNPAIAAAETRVSLGITATGYSYHEGFDNTSDQESGVLPGFSLGASRLGPALGLPDVYTGVVYDFSGGALGYQGYLQGTSQGLVPYDQSEAARFNHVEVQLGVAVPLSHAVSVLPFIATGYQSWSRNIGGSGGYGSFYHAALAGFGAKLDYAATGRLVLSASAEGLAVVGGGVSAPALGFSGSFGTSGEEAVRLGADWRLDNVWHVFAGLEMRHFNYAGSKPSNGFYEPTSSTFAARGEMGVAFGFP